jgi:hypothetical protein
MFKVSSTILQTFFDIPNCVLEDRVQYTTYIIYIQGDQKVSVHLMITIQKVTSNVQSVPRQSPDIYWHAELCSRRPTIYIYIHTYIFLLLRVFCTVTIRCTQTFWSHCICLLICMFVVIVVIYCWQGGVGKIKFLSPITFMMSPSTTTSQRFQ